LGDLSPSVRALHGESSTGLAFSGEADPPQWSLAYGLLPWAGSTNSNTAVSDPPQAGYSPAGKIRKIFFSLAPRAHERSYNFYSQPGQTAQKFGEQKQC